MERYMKVFESSRKIFILIVVCASLTLCMSLPVLLLQASASSANQENYRGMIFQTLQGSDSVGGGVQVIDIVPGSEAYEVGAKIGDIIIGVNGSIVMTYEDFVRAAELQPRQRALQLDVKRDDQLMVLSFIPDLLGHSTAKQQERGFLAGTLGVNVSDVLSEDDQHATGTMVDEIVAGGPADNAGVVLGDIIARVNGQNIRDAYGLKDEIKKYQPNTSVKLTIFRNGTEKTVRVSLQ